MTDCPRTDELVSGMVAHQVEVPMPVVLALMQWERELTATQEALTAMTAERDRLQKRLRQAEKDAKEDARGAAAEAGWKERQGDDYGSY